MQIAKLGPEEGRESVGEIADCRMQSMAKGVNLKNDQDSRPKWRFQISRHCAKERSKYQVRMQITNRQNAGSILRSSYLDKVSALVSGHWWEFQCTV